MEFPQFKLKVGANNFNTVSSNFTCKIMYGSRYVCKLKSKGKGLTVDPTEKDHDFEFEHKGGGICGIKYNGYYVFAGDQATVKHHKKSKIGNHEKFKVSIWKKDGYTFGLIRCERDQNYWYVDKEGKVRHRNPKEQGYYCHVFLFV